MSLCWGGFEGCGWGVGRDYRGCYDPEFEFAIRDCRFRDPRIRD
jgi:hypothetical protein